MNDYVCPECGHKFQLIGINSPIDKAIVELANGGLSAPEIELLVKAIPGMYKTCRELVNAGLDREARHAKKLTLEIPWGIAKAAERVISDISRGCKVCGGTGYLPDAKQAWDVPGVEDPECPYCNS